MTVSLELIDPARRTAALGGSESLSEAVDYFNKVAFLFVPNICNARCAFCYVTPKFTESATFPDAMIHKATRLLTDLRTWGFEEVRVTGGEPLAFTNAGRLFSAISAAGLRYRLLTNGINLPGFVEQARRMPPAQITISTHTLVGAPSMFGVAMDTRAILNSMEALAGTISIECTIVVHETSWRDVDETLSRLAEIGVARIKFILMNVPGSFDKRTAFASLIARVAREYRSSFDEIRFSDTEERHCKLADKGFLSIDLASLRAFACCVQPGDDSSRVAECADEIQLRSVTSAGPGSYFESQVITRLASAARRVTTFACTAHFGACPIALRSVGISRVADG